MTADSLVCVFYCGAKCFSLENESKWYLFSVLISAHENHWKTLKKNINLMFFQAKCTFKTHPITVWNAKTNNLLYRCWIAHRLCNQTESPYERSLQLSWYMNHVFLHCRNKGFGWTWVLVEISFLFLYSCALSLSWELLFDYKRKLHLLHFKGEKIGIHFLLNCN